MPRLEMIFFGGFRVFWEQQEVGNFPTDKVRALLVYLSIETNRSHRRDTLAGLFWPEMPNEDARRNLRKALFQLKATLVNGGYPKSELDGLFVISREFVRLNPDAIRLDVAEFHHALSAVDGHRHNALHLCPSCLAHLGRAASLHAHPLMEAFYFKDGVDFEDWLEQQRSEAERQHRMVLMSLAEAMLARSEYQDSEFYAARLVALDPFQEAAHRSLMKVLAAQGKRAEAIAQYEKCVSLFESELGISPESETIALAQEIESQVMTSMTPTGPDLHHFPSPATPFVGRSHELATIERHLADMDCRFLTLAGPGGIGKSRLVEKAAWEIAQKKMGFSDGLFYIPLAAVADIDQLETAIGLGLGVEFSNQSPLQDQLAYFLRERQVLLVLDNFEHLSSGAVRVAALLAACPGVKILATSRVPLNLSLETRLYLDGLTYPGGEKTDPDPHPISTNDSDAVNLFMQLSARIQPQHPVCADMQQVEDICRILYGNPLAIEMAVALTRVYSCEELIDHLAAGRDILKNSFKDAPDRHRSMAAIFEHSWNLLSPEERVPLAMFSVFRGTFSSEAALEVAGAQPEILAALVDSSLLQWPNRDRFGLHPLLRGFLEEKLHAFGDGVDLNMEVGTRHAQYYLHLVANMTSDLGGPDSLRYQARLHRELDNIRAAWEWAAQKEMVSLILDCLEGLMRFYLFAGLIQERETVTSEAAVWLHDAVAANNETAMRVFYLLYYFNANSRGILARFEPAIESAMQSLGYAHRMEDPVMIANVQGLIGQLYQDQGNYPEALKYQEEALTYMEDVVDPSPRKAILLIRLGTSYFRVGEYERSRKFYLDARAMYAALGYQPGIADALSGLGIVAYYQKKYPEAVDYNQKATKIDQALGNKVALIRHATNLGLALQASGDLAGALAAFERGMVLTEETGAVHSAGLLTTGIGSILMDQGELDKAFEWLERSIRINRDAGDRYNLSESLFERARAFMARGNLIEARRDQKEAADLINEVEAINKIFKIRLLDARLSLAEGETGPALEKMQAILQVFQEDDQQALVMDELWQVSGDPEYRLGAIQYYESSLQHNAHPDHQARLDALKKMAAG